MKANCIIYACDSYEEGIYKKGRIRLWYENRPPADVAPTLYLRRTELIAFKYEGKNGLAYGNQGEVIVEPCYDDICFAKEFLTKDGTVWEYIFVPRDGKWGVVSSNAHCQLPLEYESVQSLELVGFLYFMVQKQEKWGVLDAAGRVKIDFRYDEIGCYIPECMEAVQEPDFFWVGNYTDRRKIGIINSDFMMTVPMVLSDTPRPVKPYKLGCYFTIQSGRQYGLIDAQGQIVFAFEGTKKDVLSRLREKK